MTKEEAITELNTFRIGAKSELGETALDMAIKALDRYEDLCQYFGEECADTILTDEVEFARWLDRVKWHISKADELYDKCKELERELRNQKKINCWIKETIAIPLSDATKDCYRCNNCGLHFDCTSNFCPNCGSRNEKVVDR